ncbi:thioesterase domain-containing protein [Streptosporangium sp. NBC_01495]|uniref:thioesterase II family protein n=1 Tax=Streptosporangium sp. NBC_01495 TaxID=2903899 RepID=UPI002E37E455|nr:thioesterase domain-containing protein [Streptosporangium sp. NBC_01495]
MTERKRRRSRPTWLLRTPDPEARARLWCLPYPGSGASMYHGWPAEVDGIELCPVQLPGRENRLREPLFESYAAVAAEMLEGLEPYLDRPFGFISHCGTVFIGYEATLLLMERGGPLPGHLFASSMVPPHRASWPSILRLDEEQVGALVSDLMRARGAEPLPELVEMAADVMRADVAAYSRFDRTDPVELPCPITAIGWSGDTQIPPEQMAGWEAYGEARYTVLDGGHWSYLQAPAALLDEISRSMSARVPG